MSAVDRPIRMICHRLDVPAGIERAFDDLTTALADEGRRIEVLVLRGRVSPVVLAPHPNVNVVTGWRARLGPGRDLLPGRSRTRTSGVDVVVGLWAMVLWAPLWVRRRSRRPTVVWEHSLVAERMPNDRRLRRARPLLMWLYRRADRVVCVSDATRRYLLAGGVGDELLTVVPNIVAAVLVRPARPAGDPVRLMGLHRMTALKNTELSIRAVALLGDHYELTLLGDGDRRASAEQLARTLGVADRVRFRGFVDHPLAELLGHDVLVHPSRSETFCLAAFEAAAASIPVVCLAEGSLVETVPEHVVGVRADAPTAADFARAIRGAVALCGRPELFEAARQRRVGAMSAQVVTARWVRLLADI